MSLKSLNSKKELWTSLSKQMESLEQREEFAEAIVAPVEDCCFEVCCFEVCCWQF